MHKLRVFGWAVGFILSVLYLLNPGAGIFELIPDNVPLFGNLDEATAAVLAWQLGGKLFAEWRARRARAGGAPSADGPAHGRGQSPS